MFKSLFADINRDKNVKPFLINIFDSFPHPHYYDNVSGNVQLFQRQSKLFWYVIWKLFFSLEYII